MLPVGAQMTVLLICRRLLSGARSTLLRLTCLGVIALTLLTVPYRAHAQAPHVIDFENLQPTTVVNQYSTTGVTFNSSALRDYSYRPGFAHSGAKAIELCFAVEFCTTPLNVNFAAAQSRVKVWVGTSFAPPQAKTVILRALDQNGALIGQSSVLVPASNAPVLVNIPLEYTSASANIRQAVVTFGPNADGSSSNAGLVIDDVEFTTSGLTPCTATAPPTLTLARPTDNETVSSNQFLIQGTATGSSPFIEATVAVTNSAGSRTSDVLGQLIQPSGGAFTTNFAGALAPGENTVTVSVRQCRFRADVTRKVFFGEIASGARVRFLGLEVVQATQDRQNSVPLIANKATMVRVYLNVVGSPGPIVGVTGSLTATPPGQQLPIPPLLHSINSVTLTDSQTVGAQRLDLTSSLNFMLPPEWTAGRTLNFALSKLYVQGSEVTLPCDGCGNLDAIGAPLYSHFQATKPINIVLAPYIYTRDGNRLTPDLVFSLSGALAYMNNVYPLSGNYPVDQSGIRILSVLPVGTTSRDLSRRSDDGGEFLDLLETYHRDLAILNEGIWPSAFHILAVTPCNCPGRARRPGAVAFADIGSPQIPSSLEKEQAEEFGSAIAHEIAHNLGRMHAGNSHGEDTSGFWEEFWELLTNTDDTDYDYPYRHGGLGEPGVALTTFDWEADAPPFLIAPGVPQYMQAHEHDFMSYGGGSYEWVSPYTYKALYDRFKITAQARVAQQTPIEKVVVGGRIYVDRSVKFRSFTRAVTALQPETGAPSEYTLALVDADGRTLTTQPVATARVADGDKKAAPYLSFSEVIPWQSGTKEIVLSDKKGVLARRSVSANAPSVAINHPGRGVQLDQTATVSWTAADADGDTLTYSVFYSPGRNAAWLPLADNMKETSLSVDTSTLPGGRSARVRVIAKDGVNSTSTEAGGLFVQDKAPEVGIRSSSGETIFGKGSPIELLGGAFDAEDGMVDAKRLQWSSRGRKLGAGHRLVLGDLGIGKHLIELRATDTSGRSSSAKFELQVR
jgi:hypothetical protein